MKSANDSQVNILAIDDEAENLRQIAGILEGAGYSCHCACDAQSAADEMRQATPDLLIVDMNLAGHNGLTVCDQLKQQTGLASVPVMFLSANQGPDIIRRHHAAGAYYSLRKPFDAAVMLQLIEKVMLVPHLTGA